MPPAGRDREGSAGDACEGRCASGVGGNCSRARVETGGRARIETGGRAVSLRGARRLGVLGADSARNCQSLARSWAWRDSARSWRPSPRDVAGCRDNIARSNSVAPARNGGRDPPEIQRRAGARPRAGRRDLCERSRSFEFTSRLRSKRSSDTKSRNASSLPGRQGARLTRLTACRSRRSLEIA